MNVGHIKDATEAAKKTTTESVIDKFFQKMGISKPRVQSNAGEKDFEAPARQSHGSSEEQDFQPSAPAKPAAPEALEKGSGEQDFMYQYDLEATSHLATVPNGLKQVDETLRQEAHTLGLQGFAKRVQARRTAAEAAREIQQPDVAVTQNTTESTEKSVKASKYEQKAGKYASAEPVADTHIDQAKLDETFVTNTRTA